VYNNKVHNNIVNNMQIIIDLNVTGNWGNRAVLEMPGHLPKFVTTNMWFDETNI